MKKPARKASTPSKNLGTVCGYLKEKRECKTICCARNRKKEKDTIC
ncbi:MAG: hypothetical protein JW724_01090 [Candidatus Altiarchaeota archaeon]|nr:hypothetical protein [Candidatus Altiarchaeota archaeon]